MSMTPITYSQGGKTFSLSLTLAALNSVLTTDALNEAFRPNAFAGAEAAHQFRGPGSGYPGSPWLGELAPTVSWWADTLAASSPAAMSQIPPVQIKAVLAAALAGGGLTTEQPADAAWRLHFNQNGRDVDLLVAAIVNAAIAAG